MASMPISKRRRNALAALALAGLAVAPMTAKAESFFGLLSTDVGPAVVQSNVMRSGFIMQSQLMRRGDVYLCDVVDRGGIMQRLIIDSHTGRIVQRFALRPASWAEARRMDAPPPRPEYRDWGMAPHPQIDVPAPRPNNADAFLRDDDDFDYNSLLHPHQLAYGDGHMATPTPDPRPAVVEQKPKLKIAHPRHLPSPATSNLPETATAAPAATDPAPQTSTAPAVQPAPVQAAPAPQQATAPAPQAVAPARSQAAAPPATTQVAPTPQQQPVAQAPTPSTSGLVASSGAEAPVVKPAPAPQPAPAAQPAKKAINDIPVAPLD